MTIQRRILGRKGEEAAARYLEKNGYRILNRNYICRLGEIDMVALDGDTIVFVEVRSRTSDEFGLAQESINGRKKTKLRQLAWHYLKAEGKTGRGCRFDVVAVSFDSEGRVKRVEHIENAF
ncbi:MAG: YraN family protein [Peptococcaceae bacterium]|nr:YraN family protein [Peptococcaceae bacterium]